MAENTSLTSPPKEVIWLNGRLCSPEEAVVPVTDFGFLYGEGLFETMRSRNARIAYLDRHWARLASSAASLRFPLPDESEIRRGLSEALEAWGDGEGRVRLTVTRGSAGLMDAPSPVPPTLLITARNASPVPAGWRAEWSSLRRDENHPLSTAKSSCYFQNLIARREARSHGADEALFLNLRGEVAEGSATNVFIMKSGSLITPPISAGVLPGILRSVLLDRAGEVGLEPCEQTILPESLAQADAVFVTNAAIGITPVLSIGEIELPLLPDEEITRLRRLLWREEDFQAA
jgi:branched-chain amino acid aminotransferase